MTTIYFVGDGADALGVVDCFAFFFFAFFVSAFAGTAGVAVAAFTAGATGDVPCASATAVNAAVTSAATKCFIASNLLEPKATPNTRVDAINGRMTKKVDIDATWRAAEPLIILPEQSKN